LKNIYAALLKLDLTSITTDSVNPHFRNKYASLAHVIDVTSTALKKVGLGVIQPVTNLNGVPAVETILFHESGESIHSIYPLVAVSKQDPQGYGSAISYARRYSLLSILNLGVDDDDATQASFKAPVSSAPKPAPVTQAKPQVVKPGPTVKAGVPVMPFGDHKGKPIDQLDAKAVMKTMIWCREKGKFLDFVEAAEKYYDAKMDKQQDMLGEIPY